MHSLDQQTEADMENVTQATEATFEEFVEALIASWLIVEVK